jgi:hypothetical protein
MQGRHVASGDLRELYLMQRLGVLNQVPFDLLE